MSLLRECLEKLEHHEVLSELETVKYFESLQEIFEFTNWGRIDWDIVERIVKLDSNVDIKEVIMSNNKSFGLDSSFVILWDNGVLPGVKIPLSSLNDNLDDITAVSFDTWIFSEEHALVVEFYHEGEIILGLNK